MTQRWMALLVLAIGIWIIGCKEEGKALETVKTSKIDEFVRNPISASGEIDSNLAATITFDEMIFDFGEATEGDIIEHTFEFKNKGKSPLLISEARTTCGCTVPDWPKDPIAVGESDEIKVVFKTAGKLGYQDKPVYVHANTLPGKTVIRLRGRVNEK